MKQLVKLNKRPTWDGHGFTYFLRYKGENGQRKWDLMVTAALATAMRRAELLNCTWADVDFDAKTIEVNYKQNTRDTWEWLIKDAEHRTLPLTEDIVQMLVEHQARRAQPLFVQSFEWANSRGAGRA